MISLENLFSHAPTGLENPRQKWRLAVYIINNHALLKNPILWEARHAILLKGSVETPQTTSKTPQTTSKPHSQHAEFVIVIVSIIEEQIYKLFLLRWTAMLAPNHHQNTSKPPQTTFLTPIICICDTINNFDRTHVKVFLFVRNG